MLKRKSILSNHRWFILFMGILLLSPNLYAFNNSDSSPNETENKVTNITNDYSLPVTLTSNHQALDGKSKTSIFTDNVVIKQGSLELLADKVEFDATQSSRLEVITASGSPASYKQRLEDGSWVKASANKIEYQVTNRVLNLIGNAVIEQNTVKVTGASIMFDMENEQTIAQSSQDNSKPVTTVIRPGMLEN